MKTKTLELDQLSNKLLDAAFEPSARDIEMMTCQDDREAGLTKKDLQRGSFIAELDAEGRYKRRRGEQKDRTRDHPPARRAMLEDLLSEINLLRQLWKQNGIKIASPKEEAINVVLRRHGYSYEEDDPLKSQLVTFDKNRTHRRRR
jgi:hypothetical protein